MDGRTAGGDGATRDGQEDRIVFGLDVWDCSETSSCEPRSTSEFNAVAEDPGG